VIVRVFEATLAPGAESEFVAALRDDVAEARRQPGLLTLRWGRRVEAGATRVIVVSEWSDLDAVQHWLGPRYLLPRFAPGEAKLVIDARVRHYEGLEP
jgi:heme-degrading monooxygenase HmoA